MSNEIESAVWLNTGSLSDETLDSVLRGLEQAAAGGVVDGPDLTEDEDEH